MLIESIAGSKSLVSTPSLVQNFNALNILHLVNHNLMCYADFYRHMVIIFVVGPCPRRE